MLLVFRWSVEEEEVGGLMIGMVAIAMATNSFFSVLSSLILCVVMTSVGCLLFWCLLLSRLLRSLC